MVQKLRFLNCQSLTFSPSYAKDRMLKAQQALGQSVVRRLLCFALYLLGANRRAIGQALDIPVETAKSFLKAVAKDGLTALEDRRRRTSTFLPPPPPRIGQLSLQTNQQYVVVSLGFKDHRLVIPRQNSLQVRTVLLSMLNSGLLTQRQVSDVIGLTPAYTAALARRLETEGLSALTDKRKGQKSDYRITPEIKAELVQQFTLDIITRGKTSGEAISSELLKRCRITIPARTVRHHLARMGLPKIKHTLPRLIAAVKKTSKQSC